VSCPGFINSINPPWKYFPGLPLQLTPYINADVKSVETKKRTKPVQFSKPRMPAAAPAKQAEKNLVFVIEEFSITLGIKMSCDALSSVGVAMIVRLKASRQWLSSLLCGITLVEQTSFSASTGHSTLARLRASKQFKNLGAVNGSSAHGHLGSACYK